MTLYTTLDGKGGGIFALIEQMGGSLLQTTSRVGEQAEAVLVEAELLLRVCLEVITAAPCPKSAMTREEFDAPAGVAGVPKHEGRCVE